MGSYANHHVSLSILQVTVARIDDQFVDRVNRAGASAAGNNTSSFSLDDVYSSEFQIPIIYYRLITHDSEKQLDGGLDSATDSDESLWDRALDSMHP